MVYYFFKTYGCQANVADSQGLANYLNDLGCQEVSTESKADLIVANTCAIREKAEQKLWSYIGRLNKIKREKPFVKIGIIGCVASYKKEEIYTRFDYVSFVYGAREEIPALKAYLSDLVVQIETAKQIFYNKEEPGFTPEEKNSLLHIVNGQDRDVKQVVATRGLKLFSMRSKHMSLASKQKEMKRSMINIMTGCNKYCSYCIVPFARGRETSYPMSDIIAQAQRDIAEGAKEITLIGQNVNSYIDPETKALFPVLLQKVAELEGQFWVRFMSPHPQDMTKDLFEVMAAYKDKIPPYLHFPLQSGSNRILKAMNRNYTVEEYVQKIAWIRELLPTATISTDIIVGFPGETEEDFLATMKVVEHVRYDLVYSFIYSPRKYTKASQMHDDCPAKVKLQRLETLQKRATDIAVERNSENIDNLLTCLVEKRLGHGKLLARTEGNIRVVFDGDDDCIGSFLALCVQSTGPANMEAVRCIEQSS